MSTLILKGSEILTHFFLLAFDMFLFLGQLFLFWLNSFQLNRSKMHQLFCFQIVKTCCFLFLIFFYKSAVKSRQSVLYFTLCLSSANISFVYFYPVKKTLIHSVNEKRNEQP